jgi:hypothetical protein
MDFKKIFKLYDMLKDDPEDENIYQHIRTSPTVVVHFQWKTTA